MSLVICVAADVQSPTDEQGYFLPFQVYQALRVLAHVSNVPAAEQAACVVMQVAAGPISSSLSHGQPVSTKNSIRKGRIERFIDMMVWVHKANPQTFTGQYPISGNLLFADRVIRCIIV